MTEIKWEDATPYEDGERGEVEPRAWCVKFGITRIDVKRYSGCGNQWFVSCYSTGFHQSTLGEIGIEEAKLLAIPYIRQRLADLSSDLDKIEAAVGTIAADETRRTPEQGR